MQEVIYVRYYGHNPNRFGWAGNHCKITSSLFWKIIFSRVNAEDSWRVLIFMPLDCLLTEIQLWERERERESERERLPSLIIDHKAASLVPMLLNDYFKAPVRSNLLLLGGDTVHPPFPSPDHLKEVQPISNQHQGLIDSLVNLW